MKKLLIILFLLFFSSPSGRLGGAVYAQQPTEQWVQRFTQGNYASGISVKLDSLGNVYVLVKSSIADSTRGDYCVVKYTNSGAFIWSTFYNSPVNLNDVPVAFAVRS